MEEITRLLPLTQSSEFVQIKHRHGFRQVDFTVYLYDFEKRSNNVLPPRWCSGRAPVSSAGVAGTIPGKVIPKTLKRVVMAALLCA